MTESKERIEKLISAIEATANEQLEIFTPVSSSDLLGRLEQAAVKLFTKVQNIRVESGQALTDLANNNVQLLLWTTALQKINAADSLFYHGGKLTDFYRSIILSAMEMTRARSGLLLMFDENGLLQECFLEGVGTEILPDIISYHQTYGLLSPQSCESTFTDNNTAACGTLKNQFAFELKPDRTLINAHLVVSDKIKGLIYLANKESGEFFESLNEEHIDTLFTEEDEDMLVLFADYLVRALERTELVIALQNTVKKLQETQNQLLQADKMASIGQLAAGVAHEINNPVGFVNSNLNTLSNYLNDLFSVLDAYERMEVAVDQESQAVAQIRDIKQKLQLDYLREDVPDLLRESLDGLDRVKKIVNDLKNFSYVHEVQWQNADLHQGLDSTLNLLWNEIKYKAELIKNYGALPEVECIPSQLNQVFLNLLVNAVHAISDKGVVSITTGADEETVWITISDTGHGISEENLKRIFVPFFTTKPVGKGTGLGLSLSYSIVQKHHGKIEVSSKEDEGTSFRIVLPIKQPKEN